MRLVIDTDVLVSGVQSGSGASRVLLVAVLERVVVPLVSTSVMLEYEEVLKRPGRLSASGLSDSDVDEFLEAMMGMAERVDVRGGMWPRSGTGTTRSSWTC